MRRVAVFTEANKNIGLGHLSRCRALKRAFKEALVFVEFYISLGDSSITLLDDERELDWLSEEPSFFSKFDYLVFDSYKASEIFYNRLPRNIPKLFFDDFDRIKYPKGLILNPSASNLYTKGENRENRILEGFKYLLLRDEFKSVVKKDTKNEIRDVLLAFGGTNQDIISSKVVECLRKYDKKLDISQIVTDAYRVKLDGVRYYKNLNSSEVAFLMSRVDVAFCSGGQMLLELCSLGIPSIAFLLEDNQSQNIESLLNKGLIYSIDREIDMLCQNIFFVLKDLNFEKRTALEKRLKRSFDFLGSKRVVRELLEFCH